MANKNLNTWREQAWLDIPATEKNTRAANALSDRRTDFSEQGRIHVHVGKDERDSAEKQPRKFLKTLGF